MKNRLIQICKFGVLLIILSCGTTPRDNLIIATAANVQFAIEEIIYHFSEKTGVECEVVISSSGKITAQLLEGAPFDVFISADMQYPQRIFDAGLAIEQPFIYARGKLVLWTIVPDKLIDLDLLGDPAVKHIAIANPEIAPYGKAAQQVLAFYNMYDDIKHKLVFGESVAQVNQFVISRAVTAGFTAKSVVLSPTLKGKGSWIDIDAEAYDPIDQGVIIMSNSKQIDSAKKFKAYLLSDEAAAILHKYGYETFKSI